MQGRDSGTLCAAVSLIALFALTLMPSRGEAQYPIAERSELAAPEPRDAENGTNWSLLAPGIGVLGAGWLLNLGASLPAGVCPPSIRVVPGGSGCAADPGWDTFRLVGAIPVVGPLVQLALKPGSLREDAWAVWLVANAAVQLTGLTLLAFAILNPRPDRSPVGVEIVPQFTRRSMGISLLGRF